MAQSQDAGAELREMMRPLFVAAAAIAVWWGVIAFDRALPWATRHLLAASLVGLVLRAAYVVFDGLRNPQAPHWSLEDLLSVDLAASLPALKECLRGHDAAVDGVVAILQERLRASGPGRTLGAYLLVGPQGTGRTYLAELIGQALYPGSEPLRLRMSQYARPTDAASFLAALSHPLLEDQRRVVILDEMEKAHPEVALAFYELLKAGACPDKASGKSASLAACAFFAKCPAGSEKAFEGRFDGIFPMAALSESQVAELAILQMRRRWREQGIELVHLDPKIILAALRQDEELKKHGLSKLPALIKRVGDPSIEAARQHHLRKVRLTLDPEGHIVVEAGA